MRSTRRFRPLLLGDVRVDTHINVRAEAHASLSKKITRWFRLRISINISASFDLAVSAALATALDSGGVGFLGDVSVSVSDKGYRMAGRIPFSLQAERIDSTKQALNALLPPSISELGRLRSKAKEPAVYEPASDEYRWTYRARTQPLAGGRTRHIVVLLPAPGLEYPGIERDPDGVPGGEPNSGLGDVTAQFHDLAPPARRLQGLPRRSRPSTDAARGDLALGRAPRRRSRNRGGALGGSSAKTLTTPMSPANSRPT